MVSDSKVIQIVPAVGWRALYAGSDGSGEWSDLVCWALLDNENIEPVDTDRTGYVCHDLRTTGNFVGLFGPSEQPDENEVRELVVNSSQSGEKENRRKSNRLNPPFNLRVDLAPRRQ